MPAKVKRQKRTAPYPCAHPDCTKKIKVGKHCSTCRSRMCRERDPVRYAFNNLRVNAKRRKKFCDLTLEDFREFAYKHDYIKGKGRTVDSYTVDCIENEKGYTRGNLRALTLLKNSRKGAKKLEFDIGYMGFRVSKQYEFPKDFLFGN